MAISRYIKPVSLAVTLVLSGCAFVEAPFVYPHSNGPTTAPAAGRVNLDPADERVTITLAPYKKYLAVGDRLTLSGSAKLTDGQINANLKWSSSDDRLVNVNPETGQVTALSPGRVTVVATYALDTSKTAMADLTVLPELTGVLVTGPKPSRPAPQPSFRAPGSETELEPATLAVPSGWQGATMNTFVFDAAFPSFEEIWTVGKNQEIRHSTDKGLTWSSVIKGSSNFTTLSAVDQCVWAGNERGEIFHSPDSGQSWSLLSGPKGLRIRQLRFVTSRIGYLLADGLYRTTDGGMTWSSLVNEFISRISWVSSQRVIAVYNEGYGEWADGSWESYTVPDLWVTNMACSQDGRVRMATGGARKSGYGDLAISTDSGQHWTFPENLKTPDALVRLKNDGGLRSAMVGPQGELLVLLYSGATKQGPYLSMDEGRSWVSLAMPAVDFDNNRKPGILFSPGQMFSSDRFWLFCSNERLWRYGR